MTVSLDSPHAAERPPEPDATDEPAAEPFPPTEAERAADDTADEIDDADGGDDDLDEHGDSEDSEDAEDAVEASPEELASRIEAVLFVSDGPVPERTLRELLAITRRPLNRALDALDARLTGGGLLLQRGPEGLQLVTAPQASETVEAFLGLEAGRKLSRAALETVAIIAYRQPVTRAQIDAIRGVSSDGALATLRARELVTEVGRADSPGRPVLFGTTQRFLEHFGLARPDDLPPLPQDVELPEPERQLPLDVDAAQPEAAAPDDQPDAAAPDDRPDAAQSDAAQPEAVQSEAAQPEAAQPEAAQPQGTQPDAAQSAATPPNAAGPDTPADAAASDDRPQNAHAGAANTYAPRAGAVAGASTVAARPSSAAAATVRATGVQASGVQASGVQATPTRATGEPNASGGMRFPRLPGS